MSEQERHVQVSNGGLEDINEALAWVVQQLDGEFKGADMVKVTVEQVMTTGIEDTEWVTSWTAAVFGQITVKP